MRKTRHLLSLAVFATALAAPLPAADYVVSRYDDPFPDGCPPGDCSLREAILAADADDVPDRVVLSAGTYALTRFGDDEENQMGDLDLHSEIEIVGPGATMTTIDATELGDALDDPVMTVQFDAIALLRGVTVTGSLAGSGIEISGGTLTVERCEIRENDFQGASAGIQVFSGALTVRDSAVVNNGKGVGANTGAAVALENVTLQSNLLFQLVATSAASFTCSHCTIVGPTGGNAEVRASDAEIELANSIVVGDCAALSGGAIVSDGGNLESPAHSCGFLEASDLDDVADPGIGTFGDHGGPTRTYELLAGSPALGLGPAAACADTDQRGVGRQKFVHTVCDSGAFERNGTPATPLFTDGFEQGDEEAWSEAADA